MISKTDEWSLLERQFDALAHEKNVGPDSIEKIFDMESSPLQRIDKPNSRAIDAEPGYRLPRVLYGLVPKNEPTRPGTFGQATAWADHQTSSHAAQMINVAVVNVVTIPR